MLFCIDTTKQNNKHNFIKFIGGDPKGVLKGVPKGAQPPSSSTTYRQPAAHPRQWSSSVEKATHPAYQESAVYSQPSRTQTQPRIGSAV